MERQLCAVRVFVSQGHTCFNGIEDQDEDHRAQRLVNVVVYAINSGMLIIEVRQGY